MENGSRIKGITGKVVMGADNVRKTWKEYLEDLYNVDTYERVSLNMFILGGGCELFGRES